MNYNFSDFLHSLRRECKTKEEIISQIQVEIEFVKQTQVCEFDLVFRKIYLNRLKNTQFYFENGSIKENDIYNSLLMELFKNFNSANSA